MSAPVTLRQRALAKWVISQGTENVGIHTDGDSEASWSPEASGAATDKVPTSFYSWLRDLSDKKTMLSDDDMRRKILESDMEVKQINAAFSDEHETALDVAVRHLQNANAVKALLAKGEKVSAGANRKNSSLIHAACRWQR